MIWAEELVYFTAFHLLDRVQKVASHGFWIACAIFSFLLIHPIYQFYLLTVICPAHQARIGSGKGREARSWFFDLLYCGEAGYPETILTLEGIRAQLTRRIIPWGARTIGLSLPDPWRSGQSWRLGVKVIADQSGSADRRDSLPSGAVRLNRWRIIKTVFNSFWIFVISWITPLSTRSWTHLWDLKMWMFRRMIFFSRNFDRFRWINAKKHRVQFALHVLACKVFVCVFCCCFWICYPYQLGRRLLSACCNIRSVWYKRKVWWISIWV